MRKHSGSERWALYQGDSLEVLRTLPDNSMDSLVCDPPCGIGFMGAEWDKDKGGRDNWIAWLADILKEAMRVLKPGAHGLVWALPRTSHWTGMACEQAGFEVRDRIAHVFGSGFPKSMSVDKAIDKLKGRAEERGYIPTTGGLHGGSGTTVGRYVGKQLSPEPVSDEAKQWKGWGTCLKPAMEDWWLVRKPFKGGVAQNVLEHGTGALNIDACRIATDDGYEKAWDNPLSVSVHGPVGSLMGKVGRKVLDLSANKPEGGRWPAHLAISHEPDCEEGRCVPTCPAYIMDQQSGNISSPDHVTSRGWQKEYVGHKSSDGPLEDRPAYGDEGGASRFFYCSKPSVAEREVGCDELGEGEEEALSAQDGPWTPRKLTKRNNIHPTVKSVDLMRWMVRLVTPPNGMVLDCFAGSGTTGMAVILEKMSFVGIELDDKHCDIAGARIAAAEKGEIHITREGETKLREKPDPRQMDLLG